MLAQLRRWLRLQWRLYAGRWEHSKLDVHWKKSTCGHGRTIKLLLCLILGISEEKTVCDLQLSKMEENPEWTELTWKWRDWGWSMEIGRSGHGRGEREGGRRRRRKRWRCSQVEIRSCLMIVPDYMTRVEVNGSACPTPR